MKHLELYLFHACPFCSRVIDFLAMHDLEITLKDIKIHPEYRENLLDLGGKGQVPFLHDTKTGVKMYESSDIIEYIDETYVSGEEK